MAVLLDIPRELFLIICAFLGSRDLAKLVAVSRTTYVATQSILYDRIELPSYESLIKLTRTLVRAPVISQLTQRQRERWQLLPDSAFTERNITYIDANVVPPKVVLPGPHLAPRSINSLHYVAQLLSTVRHKSPQVEITLRVEGKEFRSTAMQSCVDFSGVRRIIVSACAGDTTVYQKDYWSSLLGGNMFPDLCHLETNGFAHDSTTLVSQCVFASEVAEQKRYNNNIRSGTDIELQRLKYLQTLKLECDIMFNKPLLLTLFGSELPRSLTTLEIVDCPELFFTADLSALSTLLQRSLTMLPALRKLKLHVVDDPQGEIDYQELRGSQHHLCSVVRALGQDIRHLDLALPFVCSAMFSTSRSVSTHTNSPQRRLGPPTISREPLEGLPQRIINKGFKYRRLISWFGVCFEQHNWELMNSYACNQGAGYSWEIINQEIGQASWHIGEHDVVHFGASHVVDQPY